jgi:RNA polymerase sigma factor (TIGR02999 family)
MSDVSRLLIAIDHGDPHAADLLLPMVYDELRRLAAQKMSHEAPGQTLQATALVHEAYLRLVKPDPDKHWDGRGHFFIAAAEAMRRVLVENARRHGRQKRGGDMKRQSITPDSITRPARDDEMLAIDEALGKLEATNRTAAELVKLRYFAGCTIPEAAGKLGMSPRKADQVWAYARSWLLAEIHDADENWHVRGG